MTATQYILHFIVPLGVGLTVGFMAYALYPHGGVMAFVGTAASMGAAKWWNWR